MAASNSSCTSRKKPWADRVSQKEIHQRGSSEGSAAAVGAGRRRSSLANLDIRVITIAGGLQSAEPTFEFAAVPQLRRVVEDALGGPQPDRDVDVGVADLRDHERRRL